MTAREAIPLAIALVRSECRYPGGRDLGRLRELAQGELDGELDDAVLAAAVRDAAGNELRGDDSGPEGGFPGHPEDA